MMNAVRGILFFVSSSLFQFFQKPVYHPVNNRFLKPIQVAVTGSFYFYIFHVIVFQPSKPHKAAHSGGETHDCLQCRA